MPAPSICVAYKYKDCKQEYNFEARLKNILLVLLELSKGEDATTFVCMHENFCKSSWKLNEKISLLLKKNEIHAHDRSSTSSEKCVVDGF